MKPARRLALLGSLLACGSAQAHLAATGLGPFVDGPWHLLTSPEDLLPVLALALLAGLRGAAFVRRAMGALPLAWLIGMLSGLPMPPANVGMLAAALWFILLGGLVFADARLALRTLTLLCALLGLAHGYLNGAGLGLSVKAIVAALGLAAAVFALVGLVVAVMARWSAPWTRIAVRVLGSWIAASGILMVGWSMRGA